jgi:hypothetical protein
MGQEERKNKAKLEKTQINLATSNTEYENAVKALEETTGRWNRDWKAAADKFQDLEEERLDFMKSSLWSFACMIHGLFDEYVLYGTYPLEALATTSVLFGGIIQQKVVSGLPLEIGLGMILEAVRDHPPDQNMYKFGLQALMQIFSRLPEWPGFCTQLLQVPGLQGTAAWAHAEKVIREQQDAENHQTHLNGGSGMTNGNFEDTTTEQVLTAPPFRSLHVDAPRFETEDPDEEIQDKIQFVLNNITTDNLETKFKELKDVVDDNSQQWFAGHLVRERAKMQPNYHHLYLNLIKLFNKQALWVDVLRDATAQSIHRQVVEPIHDVGGHGLVGFLNQWGSLKDFIGGFN